MSALAIDAGLLLIEGLTIGLAKYFPPCDGPKFCRALKQLIRALHTFEKASTLSGTEEVNEVHEEVEFHLNTLLGFFENGDPGQIVVDIIFCRLYRQITKTIDDFEHLLEIHAQKQHLLADLFENPMDYIHGHLFEYNLLPKTYYTVPVLNMLLTRTKSGTYPDHIIKKMESEFKLSEKNAFSRLERLYNLFNITAVRYKTTPHELISQLLDKKKRNAAVHVGKELVDHYRKQQELFHRCSDLASNDYHKRTAAEKEFDALLSNDARKKIQEDLLDLHSWSAARQRMEPKFENFLNSTQFKSMRGLFTNDAKDHLEKLFSDYCRSHIEKWYKANEVVKVRKQKNGQTPKFIKGRFLGRRSMKKQGDGRSRKYYIVRLDDNGNDIEIEHDAKTLISRLDA